MATEKWGESLKYPEVYPRLEEFAPKQLLNQEIVNAIVAYTEREIDEETPALVAELGAGPAPISRMLTYKNNEKFQCSAFDISSNLKSEEYSFEFNTGFDLTSPNLQEELLGKYDVVVLENVLYTTSMSPDGTEKYSPREADLMRLTALKKAAAMLKPNGILILSDPLKKTEDFGVKRIVEFLQKERDALDKVSGENKTVLELFFKNLTDSDMRRMLKINKQIMKKAIIQDEKEIASLIEDTELFYPSLHWDNQSYLGSNLTAVLRRNEKEIHLEANSNTKLGNPIILEGKLNEKTLHWIGEFRKRIYSLSNATNNLPEVDKYDRKEEGIVVVYPNKNGLGIAATATLQKRGRIGLDTEHLMLSGKNGFYSQLMGKISERSEIVQNRLQEDNHLNFAEIRRLAGENLGPAEFSKFFQSLCDVFFSYSKRNGIDIVMFVSDQKRASVFNRANRKVQFEEVDGFKLNRHDPEFETMIISAANYFLKDWKDVMSEENVKLINELSTLINNGDDWKKVIENNPKEDLYKAAVKELFEKSSDNVSIYFTDYALYS